MAFCDLWQELLGFSGNIPDEHAALSQQSYSRKSLLTLWTTQPSIMAINTSQNYRDLSDHITQMENSISGLSGTLAHLTQMITSILPAVGVKPSVIAPSIIPQHTSNFDDTRGSSPAILTTARGRIEPLPALLHQKNTSESFRTHKHILDNTHWQGPEVHLSKRARTCASEDCSEASEQSLEIAVDPNLLLPVLDLSPSSNLVNITGVAHDPVNNDALSQVNSEALPAHVNQTHCPKCRVYIIGSDHKQAAHFRDQKAEEGNGSWHILSFQVDVPWSKAKYRIYRERDFKFTYHCSKFSHYEKKEMVNHLVSLDANSQAVHKSLKEQKPSWQYK
ncbi:hypothetical protein BDR03DRAFT_987358 [Suillus americanus]|nr:hypothetical protein BDR03DRAFT_987358 [Suillus americanus]